MTCKTISLIMTLSLALPMMAARSGQGTGGGESRPLPADTVTDGQANDSIPTDERLFRTLSEVTVTAREGGGMTSSSKIGRDAMEHLQPTSFADLLELLPGNISKNPAMGSANTIQLRETGNLGATGAQSTSDDYAISSLGTLFMIDGAPVNGDANLQGIGTATGSDAPTAARSITNKGVDMRTITTDNIESVEIVRGIPSAEYGNLTSGLVRIKRVAKRTPFTARFKADEYSKLFAVAKGFNAGRYPHVINLDLSYLDSKSDPRNSLENYKRLTGSARMTLNFETERATVRWNAGADYTGSFDNFKSDPDLTLLKIDEYESRYNRAALTSDIHVGFNGAPFFENLDINTSGSYQTDRLRRRKQVAPQRASVAPTTMRPGVSVGEYLLGEYIAEYESDGRPFNLFVKGKADGSRVTGPVTHNYLAGVEWTLSKNFGHGQIYDLRRPLSASWTSRPRDFSEIPALHVTSLFAEENAMLGLGASTFRMQAGLRAIMIPSLPREYYLSCRPYLDPRVNATWDFPTLTLLGRNADFMIGGGWGLTTKMPTIDYLYPQAEYTDLVQLNYYDVNNPAEHSLVSLMTYIDDAVNHDLRAARNNKWEVRAGLRWGGFSLNVTYFQERMTSGFRYSQIYSPYLYTKYDGSGIESGTLTAPPDLGTLPSEEAKVLRGYRVATNGTRINKQGIEFTATTPRWEAIRTRLTVTGAWFRSTYSNSQTLYSPVTEIYDGSAVSDRYVGIYDYRDGRINEQTNTNFMFDTQIPRWGLVFTCTFQFVWQVKTTRLPLDGVPVSYLDADDGETHPYDPDALADPALRYLTKTYNDDVFRPVVIPFAGYFNIKATKSIGKHFKAALFVNRILDWLPEYRSNGLTVRRTADAYFGMELNISI